MRLFGIPVPFTGEKKTLSHPAARGGWLPIVRESFAGAWQQNVTIKNDVVLTYFAVFSCMTLIASDIAKLRIRLVKQNKDGIWQEVKNPAYDPIIRKPNHFQNRIQFVESWILSKLTNGNVYALKKRDDRGVVSALYILDPNRVQPLISDSGEVFYRLSSDSIAGVEDDVTVPAREIIHDRFNCLFHPLVGLSPIVAAGLAAMQGYEIQNDSTLFFKNGARPGGILTAPGAISDETAKELKEYWEANFTGRSAGKIAVLGDGLKYEAMRAHASDSQLVEQLKWTAEMVCSVFHVPPYKIGIGQMPSYNNIQSLNVEYYAQALQKLMEDFEACVDEGLNVKPGLGIEFEIDGLLRMDSVAQMDVLEKARSVMTLDERRKRLDLLPVTGGDTIYLQQQDHSIEAIAARDKLLIDEANAPAPDPEPQSAPAPEPEIEPVGAKFLGRRLKKAA